MIGRRQSALFLLGLLVLSVNVGAKDIYVSTTGSDSNGGDAPGRALRTIKAASGKANAGDTVLLMPGRYQEAIVPARSGDGSRPIVYRSYGPEPAILTHVSSGGLDSAINISGLSHIVVDGIHVDGGKRGPNATVNHFATILDATGVVIRRGVFRYANGWHGIGVKGNSSHVTIEDNEIDWVGEWNEGTNTQTGDSIAVPAASYVLVQRNILKHGGHNLVGVGGRYCVIQDNYFNNSWRDLYGGNAGGRAGAIIGSDNIFQRNFVTASGAMANEPVETLLKIEGLRNIARQNVFSQGIGDGISSEGRANQPNAAQLRIYSNTFYRLGSGAWRFETYDGAQTVGDNSFVNNLAVDLRLSPPSSTYDADVRFKVEKAGDGPTAHSIVRGNLTSPANDKTPRALLQGFEGLIELAAAEAQYPQFFGANRHARPQFAVLAPASLQDFQLRTGTLGVDEGVYLTTVVGTGKSRNLPVTDSRFFSNGFGIAAGDLIQLQGSTQRATIVAIDHVAKTLELSSDVEFKDGLGVTLAYEGRAPDIGAFEFGAATTGPAPPSQVRAE
ncbi:MAG: hypothetical protein L0387_29200 [Acidobacteria bacterium]|nr:hypothetical protein [Acidobacteriota bacterium]